MKEWADSVRGSVEIIIILFFRRQKDYRDNYTIGDATLNNHFSVAVELSVFAGH